MMLVDRLEAIVNGGFRWPMTGKVQVDEREVLDVLDLMRTTVPEEIKQARRINQEREKILQQAQTEANRLVSQAQERVERMVSADSVRQAAEDRARELIEEAQRDAEEVRRGADGYALDMLTRLDSELRRIQGSVRAAVNAMHATPPRAGEEPEEVAQ
jgi:cell division septum initiation protein DivIVA